MLKTCSTCKIAKENTLFFYKAIEKRDGYQSQCKTCRRISYNKWRKTPAGKLTSKRYKNNPKNKARARDMYYRKHYGISLIEYEQLYIYQQGKCAICFDPQSEQPQLMHVDHNHKTGKVRGLLCGRCNRAIGFFKESPSLFQAAVSYLEKSN